MEENYSLNKLRPPPPLIRMHKSPPPLCPIPTKTTKHHSYNFANDHRPFNTLWTQSPATISQQPSSIETISSNHNSANQIISSSPPPPSNALSSKRKRKAGGGNRELINRVKQQLQQLNKTLAALETVDEDDELSDDEQRSRPAHLPNDTIPHQPMQWTFGNHATVGVDTDGSNQNVTPIRRLQPAWSDPLSIEYPENGYLLPAGHLTPPSDSVDAITEESFRNGANDKTAANRKKHSTNNEVEPATITSAAGVVSTSNIQDQGVWNTIRSGRSAQSTDSGYPDSSSPFEGSDSLIYPASPEVEYIKCCPVSINDDGRDNAKLNFNRTLTTTDTPNRRSAPNCLDNTSYKKSQLKQSVSAKKFAFYCQICRDRAPEHIHYGSVSCFSCRAFFRRSVPKSHQYVCAGNKQCPISVTTRKNCQYCRYQTCLKAGMRPTWVLTEREKKERMENKKRSEEARKSSENQRKVGNTETRAPTKASQILTVPKFSVEDDHRLQELLLAQESTTHTEVLGKQVALAIRKCTKSSLEVNVQVLPKWATLEFFRVQYSRVAKFATFVDEFSALTPQAQRLLLRYNMEAVTSIRLAIYFKPATAISNNGTALVDGETLSFDSQLREMGLEGTMTIGPNICASQTAPLTIEQIFTAEWALDLEHLTFYHKTMNKLNDLMGTDTKLAIIFQMVNLFNPTKASTELDSAQRKTIESIQVRWLVLMQGYIGRKFGPSITCKMLPKLMSIIQDLRLLSERNSDLNQ